MGAGLVARVRHQAVVLLHPQAVERDPGPVILQHASETRHTPGDVQPCVYVQETSREVVAVEHNNEFGMKRMAGSLPMKCC